MFGNKNQVTLTVILKKAENLGSDGKGSDKLEPVVTFQLPGCATVTTAKVKPTYTGSSGSWTFGNFTHKFKDFEPKNNLLSIIIRDGVKGSGESQKNLGIGFVNLSSLPRKTSDSKSKVIKLDLSSHTTTTAKLELELEAEGFGCDPLLYNENEEIEKKLVLTGIHTRKDPLKNVVLCLQNACFLLGIGDAIDYINANSNPQHRTLVLFGGPDSGTATKDGHFLVEKPLKIKKDGVILFGIGNVTITTGRNDFKEDYIFELDKNVKSFFLHNIKFSPKDNVIHVHSEALVQANNCSILKKRIKVDEVVHRNDDKFGFKESNYPLKVNLDQ
eukprot:gene1691-460_t